MKYLLIMLLLSTFIFSCNSNSNNASKVIHEKTFEGAEFANKDKLDISSAENFLNSFIEARKKILAENNEELGSSISGTVIFELESLRLIQINETIGSSENIYSIAIGVSNALTYQIGDKYDDIVDLLSSQNINYSLFRGSFEETVDFNGNGMPELLLKNIDGYRTTVSGTQTIWSIVNKTEFKQLNITANTEAEIGICDGPIGFVENMVIDENRKQIQIERTEGKTNGGYEDCSNYTKEISEKIYYWDKELAEFTELN